MSLGRRDFMGATVGASLIGGSMFAGVVNAQAAQAPVKDETVTTLDPSYGKACLKLRQEPQSRS